MLLQDEEGNDFEYMVEFINKDDDNEDLRNPTDAEVANRAVESMNNGKKIYATIYPSNYMLVDKRTTTLQTDFFVGQEVFFMEKNKICKGEIFGINFTYEKDSGISPAKRKKLTLRLMYPYANKAYGESEVFASKEELVKHLMED